MTVSELLNRLSQEDPEATVLISGHDGNLDDVADLAIVEALSVTPPPLPVRESGEFPTYVPSDGP